MADTLVERVTGQTHAADVAVAIQLIITDDTACGGDDPARFADGTPYPAPMARDLMLGGPDTATRRSVRRLFAGPTGRLVAAETRSRDFTPAMADLVRLRDGTCTTPWCDAPITQIDHDQPYAHGGPTSIVNGRGLCTWCNQTKGDQIPTTTAPPDPPPPTAHRRPARRSPLERRVRRRLRAASRRPAIAAEFKEHRSTVQQSS